MFGVGFSSDVWTMVSDGLDWFFYGCLDLNPCLNLVTAAVQNVTSFLWD
jgi:hypothetical protein